MVSSKRSPGDSNRQTGLRSSGLDCFETADKMSHPGCGFHPEDTQGFGRQRTPVLPSACAYTHGHTLLEHLHAVYTHSTHTHRMHTQTCTLMCTLTYTHTTNPQETDGPGRFPGSSHLRKGGGSLVAGRRLMPRGQLLPLHLGNGALDRVGRFLRPVSAMCFLPQWPVASGQGLPVDSNCTKIPSPHYARGTPPTLAPDPAQTPPLPAWPFLFAPFLVLQAPGQALLLFSGAHTLTPSCALGSYVGPCALTALWGHLPMTR